MSVPAKRLATAADLLAIPENERRHEIINGEVVPRAMPTMPHGRAQRSIGGRIGEPYDRRPGSGGPGGWWITNEVDIQFEPHEVYRPDLAGWRRERVPEMPRDWPVTVRPDWVCEVLSRTNANNDRVKKLRVYHRSSVPHYWIVDPEELSLEVFRWTADGYLLVLTAQKEDQVRAEPFIDVVLDVGAFFGDPSA
jgi:Uma2 family endonuclease